jgi:hypothetical protein
LTGAFTLISVNRLRLLEDAATLIKGDPMRSRTIAIAASIAGLSVAASPIAAVAATKHHNTPSAARIDRSLDSRDVRHVDKTRDSSPETRSVDSRLDR